MTETKPVDFYIYADEASFRDALGPGTRENVGGEAIADIRTLFALIPPAQIDDAWVGIVIPHELTHLVFNTAAQNPYHFPPRWLNEGLAVYNSQGYVPSDRQQVDDAAKQGTLIPLDGLTGQFPTSAEKFYLAYAESVVRGRLHDPDVYGQGAGQAHQFVRRRPDGRRGVQRRARRRHGHVRAGLADRPQGGGPDEVRTTAGCRGSGAVGLDVGGAVPGAPAPAGSGAPVAPRECCARRPGPGRAGLIERWHDRGRRSWSGSC